MRILIASYQHETNTFAPSLADWAAFEAGSSFPAYRRGASGLASFDGVNLPTGGFMAAAREHGWHLIPSVFSGATPSSYVTADSFDRICHEIVEDVNAAMTTGLDAIYLDLHGAAVAQNADDSEGELLARIRAVTGDALPIVASLDLHANVTERMLGLADALVSYRTYPHVDMADTGRLAATMLKRRMARGSRERLVHRRIPYLIPINAQSTVMQPAKGIYERLAQLDAQHSVVLNFCMGFPASDFAECAPMVWGYGDAAEQGVQALYAAASPPQQWDPGFVDVREAVSRAVELAKVSNQVIVIADTQDNPGAGGDSNTTGVLHELLRQGAGRLFPNRVALGMLHDPLTAQQAHAAARAQAASSAVSGAASGAASGSAAPLIIDVSLGQAVPTFTGQLSDPPLHASAQVEGVADGECVYKGPMMTGVTARLGASCALNIEGVRVAVVSGKAQLLDRELLRMVGIEPEQMKIIVVKSSNHFRADFTPLVADPARDIIIAKAAGPMAADPADLPWKKLSQAVSPKLPT